ncbi:hypothetical protein [Gluconobacter japonicus]|uniref:hypothetical protein n=1 Tax=Gluconobacter japonicus TaxID=376620 RepID=UPI0007812A01|nr:hypothetical protein [Gluconobacter japonicus]KXV25292.1 hypothetical protein AD938_11810 [Gluconobacter japonicus]
MTGLSLASSGLVRARYVHGLFPFGAGRMVTDGAARSGRRTPEPHVWPAAPLQFTRGDGWRGAAMDNRNSSDPEWFSLLSPVDQSIASRLIRLSGEAAFRRIATAAARGQAKRGRSKEKWDDAWLSEGYRLWLLSPDASFEKIAKEVIEADQSIDPRIKDGRIRALRDELTQSIKKFNSNLKNETVGERLKRFENPDLFTKVENKIFEEKRKVARNGNVMDVNNSLLKFIRFMGGNFSKIPDNINISRYLNKEKINNSEKKRITLLKMEEREGNFYDAFSPLLDHMPVTQARRIYEAVSGYVEEEAKAFNGGPKKS